jgi:hypothetical protein
VADLLDGDVVLGAQLGQPRARRAGDRHVVCAHPRLERLEHPRVDRQRPVAHVGARKRHERRGGVGVPQRLQAEALLVDRVADHELGARRFDSDLQARGAAHGRRRELGARLLEQRVGGLLREGQPPPALVGRVGRRVLGQRGGHLAGDRADRELAAALALAHGRAPQPPGGDPGKPGADVVCGQQVGVAGQHVGDVDGGHLVLRDRPLLVDPVEAPARDRAHRVDEIRAVRKGEDDDRLPRPVEPQLDVGAWRGEIHAIRG